MKPNYKSGGGDKDFEQVALGELIPGVISEVKYDMEHKFKGWNGGPEVVCPGVRIILKLDGYKEPHGTPWMKFNYGAKANLYLKFLLKLVDGAKPDMCDFDLDALKGMKVKTLWCAPYAESPEKQFIESIVPVGAKVKQSAVPPKSDPARDEDEPPAEDSEIPF